MLYGMSESYLKHPSKTLLPWYHFHDYFCAHLFLTWNYLMNWKAGLKKKVVILTISTQFYGQFLESALSLHENK